MLQDNIKEVLLKNCRLEPERPIIVGVSGGPDSLVLLHVMKEMGISIIAAHLDHGLRQNSQMEAEYVSDLCKLWGITCIATKVPVRNYIEEHKLSLEEGARECRYQFLFKQAEMAGAQAVAVAHNADDQVETVLMHFLRGAGVSGLKGMTYCELIKNWSDYIPVWRPMLGIWREEIIAYCDHYGLKPVIDESNADVSFFRNRLRHVLLKELQDYNPQIKKVLWRMSAVIQGDDALLKTITDEAWKKVLIRKSAEMICINSKLFFSTEEALQRRILRQAINQLRPGLRDVGLEVIERARRTLIKPPASGRIDLAMKLDLIVKDDVFYLVEQNTELPVDHFPQIRIGEIVPFVPGDRVILKNNWQLTSEIITSEAYLQIDEIDCRDPWQAWINAEKIQSCLLLRGRTIGDRWQPLGMQGHTQKISDLFINEKIPAPARDGWPLVVCRCEIIWVAGLRPSETFKLEGGEKIILHLKVAKT